MSENVGKIVGINGNLITVQFDQPVTQSEVGYARTGDIMLKSEVIRIRGANAELQVFEDTTGLKVGDPVEFSGNLLAVELGPGLLAQVYDGLQNPLPKLAEQCGFFLQRGKCRALAGLGGRRGLRLGRRGVQDGGGCRSHPTIKAAPTMAEL